SDPPLCAINGPPCTAAKKQQKSTAIRSTRNLKTGHSFDVLELCSDVPNCENRGPFRGHAIQSKFATWCCEAGCFPSSAAIPQVGGDVMISAAGLRAQSAFLISSIETASIFAAIFLAPPNYAVAQSDGTKICRATGQPCFLGIDPDIYQMPLTGEIIQSGD